MKAVVPQVEYVSGNTRQESASLLNARIMELRFSNPTIERDGIGFWLTYNKEICDSREKSESPKVRERDGCLLCMDCPYFERTSDKVKWGKCGRYGGASVSGHKIVCAAYWEDEDKEMGGDELDA